MNNELKNAENHLSKSAFENLKIWFFDERYKEFHTEIEKLIIDEKEPFSVGNVYDDCCNSGGQSLARTD